MAFVMMSSRRTAVMEKCIVVRNGIYVEIPVLTAERKPVVTIAQSLKEPGHVFNNY